MSRVGAALATLTLIVGLLGAAAALLAGPAYRAEALTLAPAIQTMRWAATVALGGAAVALVAVLLLLARPLVPRARGRAALALLVNLIVAAPPLYMYWQLQHLPKIHDISTSPSNPPAFEAVLPLRKGARNAVDYPASTAAEQLKGYPDIGPLTLPLAPPVAFERAVQAARAMGWDDAAAALDKLVAEATDTTLSVRLQDDVVVRITPQGKAAWSTCARCRVGAATSAPMPSACAPISSACRTARRPDPPIPSGVAAVGSAAVTMRTDNVRTHRPWRRSVPWRPPTRTHCCPPTAPTPTA
jgi:hypothetical protein